MKVTRYGLCQDRFGGEAMDSNNDLRCVYNCCISITLFQQRASNSIVMILGQLFKPDVTVPSFSYETSTGAVGYYLRCFTFSIML